MPGPAFREGETVSLHTLEREDLAFVARLRADPRVRRRAAPHRPESDVELETWFEEQVSGTDTDETGAQFAVVPTEGDVHPDGGAVPGSTGDGADEDQRQEEDDEDQRQEEAGVGDGSDEPSPRPVGYAALTDVERPAGTAEVSVAVAPEYRGRGYGTDAVRELVAYGVEELRLTKVRALTLADDDAGRAVLETVGFRVGETRREARFVGGERVDVVAHWLLAEDWFDRPDTTRGLPDRPPGATAAERGHRTPFATSRDGQGDAAGGGDDAGDGAGSERGGGR